MEPTGRAPAPPHSPQRGLTSADAGRRLEEHGPNALPDAPPVALWRRFLGQFRSALIYVLIFALAVDLGAWFLEGAVRLPFESIAIALILLLNAVLGVWQEHRAENTLATLRDLEAPQAWVFRDRRLERIPSRDIVPGDLTRIAAGARVPADAHVDGEQGLLVDESILTGESVPVEKAPGAEVFAGTLVVRGAGYAKVARTGPASTMGRIAGMLGELRTDRTPLEERLDVFGSQIARWVFLLSVLLVAGNVAVEGVGRLDDAFLWAVALAVAAIPEGLPAVLTLTLALGVERMSKRRAVVRKLASVEALGSVTVIATDKTGTLTENRMLVRHVESEDLPCAVRAMVLSSDAEPDAGGDPLESGLFSFAREQGIDPTAVRLDCPRQSERPFDSAWKFMRVTVQEDGALRSYLKGAPEVLLSRCDLTDEERARWSELALRHAGEGLRVLALACGEGVAERNLSWLGLVLFWDPPRAEVPDAVRAARAAGVRVLMLTGDHPSTAASVARMVGIDCARIVTGAELEAAGPDGIDDLVADVDVFARVAPEHKVALVEALRRRGEVVAVTGDGVNDAPALKRADVGIAMGQRGTDVSREVADLVLLDDNFATIVAAIEEGRNIYANIQTFIRFLFSTNVALVLLVAIGAVGAALLGVRDAVGVLLVPLTAAQLLWVNIIADGPPALAVGLDRSSDVMKRRPRPRDAALFDPPAVRFVLITGGVKAATGLALLAGLPLLGLGAVAARTAVFLYETLAQLAFVYPSRALVARPLPNHVLNAIVLVSVLLQPAVMFMPGMRRMLGIEWLDPLVWAAVAGGVLLSWLFADIYTRRTRRRADPAGF